MLMFKRKALEAPSQHAGVSLLKGLTRLSKAWSTSIILVKAWKKRTYGQQTHKQHAGHSHVTVVVAAS